MQVDYSKELLELEDVKVTKVVNGDKKIKVYLETDAHPQICPHCGGRTKQIHDYRMQTIKDIRLGLKNVVLVLRKRRYHCNCGKHFYEKYAFLPRYLRRTNRLTFITAELLKDTISLKQAASITDLSSTTVSRIIDEVSYARKRFGKVIAIDEFRGNATTGKYQCIITDPKRHQILDILPDRKEAALTAYFKRIDRSERYRVEYFVCDMWRPYAEMARVWFPNAKVCVDKFHFQRQVIWAIEKVRKEIQKTMEPRLRKYYKRSRKLLLARYETLNEEDRKACDLMLLYHDKLRKLYWFKEKFFAICREKKYSLAREDFKDWIRYADQSGIKELRSCAQTFRNWSKEILNALKYGYTNGVTEGFNNKIKVMKRTSYGIRNFERFRTRILHCSN